MQGEADNRQEEKDGKTKGTRGSGVQARGECEVERCGEKAL